MADRRERERCSGCHVELQVPPQATAIRCVLCQAITPVRHIDNMDRVQDQVRQAASWVKGFMTNVPYKIGSVAASMNNDQPGSIPASYSYYSHPTAPVARPLVSPMVHGNKRAVLCGISYRFRKHELKGSINDVNCMRYFLVEKLRFPNNSIFILTEDEKGPNRNPTKQNIRIALRWLVHGCQSGDSLVFHYSGHGAQQRNFNGEEIDGYDETLCPLDYETEGMIVDDEINATIVRPLPKGATLHAIMDACHSGTVLDLPFLCRMDQNGQYMWENQIPPSSGTYKGTSGGLALSFSACDDHQTSADTSALTGGGIMTGAMTYSFIQAAQTAPGLTYGCLLNAMRSAIREANTGPRFNGPITSLIRKAFGKGLSQVAQLSSSEEFDIYKKPFIL